MLVGLLAALFAVVLGWVPEGKFSIIHGLLLAVSSVLTAGIASFVLGMTTTCYSPLCLTRSGFMLILCLLQDFLLYVHLISHIKSLFLLLSLLPHTSPLHFHSRLKIEV